VQLTSSHDKELIFLLRNFFWEGFESDFIVKRDANKADARVYSKDKEIAEIRKDGQDFLLVQYGDGVEWRLSNKVHGERRPFSFSVLKSTNEMNDNHKEKNRPRDVLFVVRDQLFEHNGNFYMLANHPQGKHWNEHVRSTSRYISRLDNFPYREFSEIDFDHHTLRNKIKRFRGTPVGETSGLATEPAGHLVHLSAELESVGLFIAAISYLMYAST